MLVLALIVAATTVVGASVLALMKPDWLRRAYPRWTQIVLFLAWSCFLWVFITSTSAVGQLADRLTYAPDSTLRTSQSVILYARRVQQTYHAPLVILLIAGFYVWGLGLLRTHQAKMEMPPN